jgi:hypothetical protein
MSTQAERQPGEGVSSGQLRLLTDGERKRRPRDWSLDEHTREVGRAGVAAIRETLRRAQPPQPVQKAS